MALEVLEPCAVKVASTVLRGSGDGDISALLDRALHLLREGQECEFISLKCLLDTVPASALFCPPSFSVQQHLAGGGGMAQHGGWSRIARFVTLSLIPGGHVY